MISFSTSDLIVALNKVLHLRHSERNELKHSFLLENFTKKNITTVCISPYGLPKQLVSHTIWILRAARSHNYFWMFETVILPHENMTFQKNYSYLLYVSGMNCSTNNFTIPLGGKNSYLKPLFYSRRHCLY